MRRAAARMLALHLSAPPAAARALSAVPMPGRQESLPREGESLQRAALRVLCEPDVARKVGMDAAACLRRCAALQQPAAGRDSTAGCQHVHGCFPHMLCVLYPHSASTRLFPRPWYLYWPAEVVSLSTAVSMARASAAAWPAAVRRSAGRRCESARVGGAHCEDGGHVAQRQPGRPARPGARLAGRAGPARPR